ncbi:pyridoxamine 5'-phosphate oxidase family protein [Streptomyces sp. NPDC001401]|uniref:pyridoxamine 5'-phosphate oxidase family protein n=1 Tax=Streptomyces sp. NPDC001401 TaxID=3364570 RepID=UPI0036C35E4D
MKDETARRLVRTNGITATAAAGPRRLVELSPEEALRLLGTVPLGRLVFTRQALPTARPVNHVLDRGDIVIRTHEDAALLSRARQSHPHGVVVAYEADDIDVGTRLGWSVVATGYCHPVTDPAEVARYQALVHPWLDHPMDHVVRIRPGLITGMRLVDAALPRSGDAAAR